MFYNAKIVKIASFLMLMLALTEESKAEDCAHGNALSCYTQALVRLQAAQDALASARNDIKSLQDQLAISSPVGAVVPMFLSPQQIAMMAPAWLPADGRKVEDPISSLNGEQLPDLRNRFVLGGEPSATVIPSDQSNVNGTLSLDVPFAATGTTSGANVFDVQGRVGTNYAPRFVIDTTVDEVSSANHNHSVTVNGKLKGEISQPPYRKLIYMVHCR